MTGWGGIAAYPPAYPATADTLAAAATANAASANAASATTAAATAHGTSQVVTQIQFSHSFVCFQPQNLLFTELSMSGTE